MLIQTKEVQNIPLIDKSVKVSDIIGDVELTPEQKENPLAIYTFNEAGLRHTKWSGNEVGADGEFLVRELEDGKKHRTPFTVQLPFEAYTQAEIDIVERFFGKNYPTVLGREVIKLTGRDMVKWQGKREDRMKENPRAIIGTAGAHTVNRTAPVDRVALEGVIAPFTPLSVAESAKIGARP